LTKTPLHFGEVLFFWRVDMDDIEKFIEGLKILKKAGAVEVQASYEEVQAGARRGMRLTPENEARLSELKWHKDDENHHFNESDGAYWRAFV
jgi:hypothetical protein